MAEASLAKSLLDDHKIFCTLADENVNLYGGGPLAMPVRLLVTEEHAHEASRILETKGPGLPDDFNPGLGSSPPATTEDINQQIISELGNLRHTNQWIAVVSIVVLVLAVYLVSELPRRTTSPWTDVSQAMRRYDYGKALELAKKLTAEHPSDYYGHESLGNIYSAMGDWEHAEAEYSRAYELFPPPDLQRKLEMVRQHRGR